jgi:hypothetical protein
MITWVLAALTVILAVTCCYLYFRRARQTSVFTYDPKEVQKQKERIVKHAEDERKKIKEEADKARSAIDDF